MEETVPTLPPKPQETGAALDQRIPTDAETKALIPIVEDKEKPSGKLSACLGELGESGVRGHAAAMLLHAGVAHLEGEIEQLRRERDEATRKAERYQELYYEEKERAAVLRVERDVAKTVSRFRQALQILGAALGGIGLRGLAEDPWPVWAMSATIFGVVILVTGWVIPDRRTPEGKE